MKKPKIFEKKKDSVEEKIDEFLEKDAPQIESREYCTDEEFERLLSVHDHEVKAYETKARVLRELSEAKAANNRWNKVSADTIVSAGVTLLGIVLMLNFEKTDIIKSKVTSFIPKVRI